ncbi:MAG: 50S ribosomal protein L18, partial [Candidatus Bathyarchaeota archaeon]|nr:50S ribosomal protein L18 [Candidatus Bathyarchaeota archaeon]
IPRLAIRPTNKHIMVQLIEARPEGDFTLISASSAELMKRYDWKANCGNLPAAYLTGLLAGYKAREKDFKKAVLDIGLHISSRGSRIYSALKGAIDAGMEIPHSEEILPNLERIQGKHILNYSEILKENVDPNNKQFSKYISKKFDPKGICDHFEEVKEKIIQDHPKVKAKA